jgi:predicted CopG family antitoxin
MLSEKATNYRNRLKKEGYKEGHVEVAFELIKRNYSNDDILYIVSNNLSIEEIEKLRTEINPQT